MTAISRVTIPKIHRAREYRLYDGRGKRYLDFFQDNGHAIMGHRPQRTILEIKNTLSRGQLAAYPSSHHYQTLKALARLDPELPHVRIYRSIERAAYAASLQLGFDVELQDIVDPALNGRDSGPVAYWRPFFETGRVDSPVLLPILPVPMPPAPCALLFRDRPSDKVPESDTCSPASLAAMKRAVYDLLDFIDTVDRSRWHLFDTIDFWSRKGPYLTLAIEEDAFRSLFKELLRRSILISPIFPGPSIIPAEYSPGEITQLQF